LGDFEILYSKLIGWEVERKEQRQGGNDQAFLVVVLYELRTGVLIPFSVYCTNARFNVFNVV